MKKIFITILFLFLLMVPAPCQTKQEAEQTIADFNLSGFGEKGKKSWELSGKSADIFSDTVALKNITGKLYGEKEDIMLSAQEGIFDKQQSLVHLEKDVVITTSSGAQLSTNSLDWDRKNQIISTKDPVNIKKEEIVTRAQGAIGHPDLKKISLEKDVTVEISPKKQEGKEDGPIVITCDGPLEIDYEKNIAVFNNNVKVEQKDFVIYSDIMDVYFTKSEKERAGESAQAASVMGANLDKIVARGNVKITRGENVSYSDEATYTASDRKIILTGRPKLVIYSTQEFNNAASGN
jgi:LPS export ABC transporter protein LptC